MPSKLPPHFWWCVNFFFLRIFGGNFKATVLQCKIGCKQKLEDEFLIELWIETENKISTLYNCSWKFSIKRVCKLNQRVFIMSRVLESNPFTPYFSLCLIVKYIFPHDKDHKLLLDYPINSISTLLSLIAW